MGEAGGYRGQVLYDSNSLCPQRREYPSLSSHFPDVVQKENWLKSPQQSRTKNGVRLWQKNSLCLAKHNVQKECHDIMLSRPVGINSKVERSKNNNLKCQRKIVFAHVLSQAMDMQNPLPISSWDLISRARICQMNVKTMQ